QESITGNKVVKIFGREEFERARFRDQNEQLTRTFISSERIQALTGPVNEVLAAAAIAGVILYGGYSVVVSGTRSQGDFIAFLTSVFLLYEPFKKLSRVHNNIQLGLSGADRIFEILDTDPQIVDPKHPVSFESSSAEIFFDSISFSYPNSETEALREVTLRIREGSKVALVGLSGSGKTSLVSLIPRFIDPERGRVTLGGTDIRNVSLAELRKRIAMVDQHTFLFNDTIFQNISYGKEDASEEEVHAAAKAAQAFEFISQLPNGFQTQVGEAGMTLSGGERQRIAIARAVLKNAPILILDEATASLDNHSEREVQKALRELERERTSIVIAHRLSTVLDADMIVVMSRGRIVEQGTHEELLEKRGEYKKLYELQFSSQELLKGQTEGDAPLSQVSR
ncbi:MAG: ABC transporter ATP-binding protein, partial [Bdellovibrionales bacterium]|nr:ABC transporter ATP-binding protein [Bdellovibrionales bacterium]